MDCVDGDGEPPPELSLGWQCERWHALPEAGGFFDQDAQLMYRMAAFLNVHNAMSALRNAQGEQIHRLTDGQRRVLGYLQRQGLIFHA